MPNDIDELREIIMQLEARIKDNEKAIEQHDREITAVVDTLELATKVIEEQNKRLKRL